MNNNMVYFRKVIIFDYLSWFSA